MINAASLTDYAKTFSDAVCILAVSITLCADAFLDWLHNETWRKAIDAGHDCVGDACTARKDSAPWLTQKLISALSSPEAAESRQITSHHCFLTVEESLC